MSFWTWMVSLSIMSSRFIHIVSILWNFPPFEGGIIFNNVCTSPFAYAFIHLETLPPLSSCELCCSEHRDTISQDSTFSSFGCIPRSGIAGSHGNSVSLRSHHTCVPAAESFYIPALSAQGSSFSTSSPALVYCFIFFF